MIRPETLRITGPLPFGFSVCKRVVGGSAFIDF